MARSKKVITVGAAATKTTAFFWQKGIGFSVYIPATTNSPLDIAIEVHIPTGSLDSINEPATGDAGWTAVKQGWDGGLAYAAKSHSTSALYGQAGDYRFLDGFEGWVRLSFSGVPGGSGVSCAVFTV